MSEIGVFGRDRHKNWEEIVVFGIDVGRYWMEKTNQLPDGDIYTAAIARGISEQYRDAIKMMTAMLIVKMLAHDALWYGILGKSEHLQLGQFAERWCVLFGSDENERPSVGAESSH